MLSVREVHLEEQTAPLALGVNTQGLIHVACEKLLEQALGVVDPCAMTELQRRVAKMKETTFISL